METDDLIRSLARDLAPMPRRVVERRIALGMGGGAILTLAAVALILGLRPDLGTAMRGFAFWMKWTYTISIDVGAIAATVHLARPDAARARWLWLLVVPVGLLGAGALGELMRTPVAGWLPLWLGQSWKKCAILVVALSVPIFIGLTWAFRRFAPSRPRLTGAAAGLASGASAATLYGLHCPEVSAPFVLTWYSLGMALAALGGALVGPRLLRW